MRFVFTTEHNRTDGDGAVVTAAHVLPPDKDVKKGYLVASTADGKVLPVAEAPPDEPADKSKTKTSDAPEEEPTSGALFQLHDAIPARGVLLLLKAMEKRTTP